MKLLLKAKAKIPKVTIAPDDHEAHAKHHEEKMKYNQSRARAFVAPFISNKYKQAAAHHEKKMNFHLAEHKKKTGGGK